VFDATIAVVLATLGVLEAFWGIGATHRQGPPWAQALLYVVTALLLLGRRSRPLGCLTAVVAVSLVEFAVFGSPEGQGVAFPAMVAAYSVGRYVERRRSWLGLALVVALWAGWVWFDPVDADPAARALAAVWLSPWVIAWLVGALVRATRQTAEQRRVSRAQRTAQAVAEERNRIARELHDVIGHSVSVMTVQAAAVRRRLTVDQEVERQALQTVEAVGREALTEMRRMLGMLRGPDDGTDREPAPGLSGLDRLVDKFRAAGLAVDLETVGRSRQLPPGIDLTAYRLVQEGLTNALRHAVEPRAVLVRVGFGDHAVEVSVRDDGRLVGGAVEPGHGLVGMRERVAMYGGRFRAGPGLGSGFELHATLPVEERLVTEVSTGTGTGTGAGPSAGEP
jgi:signal transduction histidine kinase